MKRFAARLASFVFAISALSACYDDAPAHTTNVQVWNDSPIAITTVRIALADGVEINESNIAAGVRTKSQRVRSMHENPAITFTAAGRNIGLVPIEGFSPGFNAVRPAGDYLIRIRVADNGELIRVDVTA